MILDSGIFSRWGLMVDHGHPADTCEDKAWNERRVHGGCRRQSINLSAMGKCSAPRLSFIVRDFNNLECLGFHSVKLSKT